jgi:hypothetical protein
VKGDIMKVKKYLFLAAAVSISICAVVLSRGYPNIDAITRPSPDTAVILLYGIKSIWVDVEIRANGSYCSKYKGTLSHKNLLTEVTRQLKKANVLLKSETDADGSIWVDIQITTREETQFVAANISVAFAERMPLKRKPMWPTPTVSHFYGTTWQSRATLLVHKDKLSEEVQKCVQYLVRDFSFNFLLKQTYEKTQPKQQKEKQ